MVLTSFHAALPAAADLAFDRALTAGITRVLGCFNAPVSFRVSAAERLWCTWSSERVSRFLFFLVVDTSAVRWRLVGLGLGSTTGIGRFEFRRFAPEPPLFGGIKALAQIPHCLMTTAGFEELFLDPPLGLK